MHHIRRKFRTVAAAREHPAIGRAALPVGNAALHVRNADRRGNHAGFRGDRATVRGTPLGQNIGGFIGAGASPAEREST